MHDVDDALRAEVETLRALATERARAWSELARRRRLLHYAIGVPAVALASLAGAAALADLSTVVAGLCALAAAVLTGLQTFLRPDAGAIRAREQAVGWAEVDDDARILLEIDFAHIDGDERRARFEDLHARARSLQRETIKMPAGTEPAP